MPRKRIQCPTALIVAFTLTGAMANGERFLIPVLPDTQGEVSSAPAMFTSQMNWIAANRSAANIPFVLHVGDVINWDTPDHSMWITASNGFKILDNAGIPYVIALGNHDTAAVTNGGSAAPGNVNANLRNTASFNAFFPPQRFKMQQERYEAGKSDNSWHRFEAGGLKWLVLNLELWARPGAVEWAKNVVASQPDHNVIVVTHAHLTSGGGIQANNGGYGDLSPQTIFDQFLKQCPNILLVLSGHVCSSAWRNDAGLFGNRIYQILSDYQCENNGNGWIRLLTIDTAARTIFAQMYSPYLGQVRNDSSSFVFSNVNFVTHAALPADPPVVASFSFKGVGIATGWSKTAGVSWSESAAGIHLHSTSYDGKLYRAVSLAPGDYIISYEGRSNMWAQITTNWYVKSFPYEKRVNMGGALAKVRDYFKIENTPVQKYLVIGVNGINQDAFFTEVKIQTQYTNGPLPRLNGAAGANNSTLLYWPANPNSYGLISASNLAARSPWQEVLEPVLLQNGLHISTVQSSGVSRVFRLRRRD